MSKLQFNSNKRPGLVWPGTWFCVAVFPGPGVSLVALRKGSNMLALAIIVGVLIVVVPVGGYKPTEAPV